MTPLSKDAGLRTGVNRRSTMSGFITKTAAGIAAAATLIGGLAGEVVDDGVHDDADAVLVGLGGHGLEVVFGTDDRIADRGAGRLVDVVPVLGEFLALHGSLDDADRAAGIAAAATLIGGLAIGASSAQATTTTSYDRTLGNAQFEAARTQNCELG